MYKGLNQFLVIMIPAFLLAFLPVSQSLGAAQMNLSPSGGNVCAAGFCFSWGTGGGGIAGALCTIVGWFKGPVGKAIASLAVIFLGIAAFFGKAQWGTALLYAAGITAIFSADQIINAVVPAAAGYSCNTISI
jgi:type IV secretory pathway VirB2 component (pilin)